MVQLDNASVGPLGDLGTGSHPNSWLAHAHSITDDDNCTDSQSGGPCTLEYGPCNSAFHGLCMKTVAEDSLSLRAMTARGIDLLMKVHRRVGGLHA